ncbi:MAG: HDIG domain-containing protein [Phycisphaerae bacterium]|nr:HDIG domain-containing protein [Phycisphaerae bacterium]
MALNRPKSKRGEASRWGPGRAPSWAQRIRAAKGLLGLGVAVGFFVLASVIIIQGGEPFPYRLGQTLSGEQIVARVPVPDPQKLRSLQEVEELNTANYYVLNEALLKGIEAAMRNLREKASANETLKALTQELAKQKQSWTLDEQSFKALREMADETGAKKFNDGVKQMLAVAKAEPLVRQLGREDRWPPSAAQYVFLQGHSPSAVSNDRLKYVSNSEHVDSVVDRLVREFPAPLRKPIAAKWREVLQPDPDARIFVPIYEFDKETTTARIKEARTQVSWERAAKPAGSPICEPNVIDEADIESLRLEHAAFMKELDEPNSAFRPLYWQRAVGIAGIVLFITIGLSIYAWWFGAIPVKEPRLLLDFAGVMLVMLLLARLGAMAGWPQELAVVPVAMAGAILTIGFDQRFAFGAAGGLAGLITLAVGGDFGLMLILIASMGVIVANLGDIRTRGKVLDAGGMTAIAAFLLAVCVNLLDQQTLRFTGQLALTAAASGLAAGFLVFGILPLIERIFGVTTALTLLEWGSMHQPLLRRLREEAPGTYSHSQTLGDMAERAADAIGADGLLARTGAYYHDVGKIIKPNYFVENYEMRVDQHKKLQPTMSMLIIVGHVRDGMELARQYALPRVLTNFIAEHHGTTLVEYFYHEATARQTADGKPGPSETEFRYPGPKPQSKESAILMLCDAVEGAIRAMAEPTAGRIESTVHQIAMKRLMDGQLDECNMTLKDLRRVEDSLTRSLITIYHGRIAYPKAKGEARPDQLGSKPASAG